MAKILILAPHPDDGEFGCGATIHRLIEEGNDVKYIAFSDCKESMADHLPEGILIEEMMKATAILNIKKEQVELLHFPVRRLKEFRQEILEHLVKTQKEFLPDMVFTPCTKDIHQDHETITQEARRAFKKCTIYGYELPWNLMELPSTCLFKLSKNNIEAKKKAISAYETQIRRGRNDATYVEALAITRGRRIDVEYAEAFEVIRLIQ